MEILFLVAFFINLNISQYIRIKNNQFDANKDLNCIKLILVHR